MLQALYKNVIAPWVQSEKKKEEEKEKGEEEGKEEEEEICKYPAAVELKMNYASFI